MRAFYAVTVHLITDGKFQSYVLSLLPLS
ncbi:unnamed protein product, partial [Didymodactylos carnosus]